MLLKRSIYKAFILLLFLWLYNGCSRKPLSMGQEQQMWTKPDQSVVSEKISKHLAEHSFYFWQLTENKLKKLLATAADASDTKERSIWLPLPDGTLSQFTFSTSGIMAPALASKFPELQTFSGQGINQPAATTRFEYTPEGFKAIILSPEGTIYIHPIDKNNTSRYISYFKSGILPNSQYPFELQAPIKE